MALTEEELADRGYPAPLRALLATGWCGSYPAVEIYFRDGTNLCLSTRRFDAFPVGERGVALADFRNELTEVQTLRMGMTKPIDSVTVAALNVQSNLGLSLVRARDALRGAHAVFSRIYAGLDARRDPAGPFFRVLKVRGKIRSPKLTETAASFSIVSNVYAGKLAVGVKVQVACGWPYSAPGNRNGDCAYDGDLPTCAHTWEDCALHKLAGAPEDPNGNRLHYGGGGLYREQTAVITDPSQIPDEDLRRIIAGRGGDFVEGPGEWTWRMPQRPLDAVGIN